jgi:hypothetical protein
VDAQVWRWEGNHTLAHFLRRRDCIPALARSLRVPEAAVPATVMKHILESLMVRLLGTSGVGLHACIKRWMHESGLGGGTAVNFRH